jgi:mono/diheme cytochrome c family protein
MRPAPSLASVALTAAAISLVACSRGPAPSADAGRELYRQNGCATCHGPDGHGDGRLAGTLATRPRDFRDTTSYKQGTDVAAVAESIGTGVVALASSSRPGDEHHRQVMPPFSHLSEWERRSLALYVISLGDPATSERSRP